jgi:hypothetical protein
MKRLLALSLLFLVVSFIVVTTASAASCDYDIDVDLSCPRTVAAGQVLNVAVTACSNESVPGTLDREMVGLIGNRGGSAGGTLGGAGIYGPFKRGVSFTVGPGHCVTKNVRIVNAVPSQLTEINLFSLK